MDKNQGKPSIEEKREIIAHRSRNNIALGILIAIATVWGITKIATTKFATEIAPVRTPAGLFVIEINGAVENPGDYRLFPGDTLKELVILAGGFSEWADSEMIDLNENLHSGVAVVRIPFRSDYLPPPKPPKPGEVDFPININTATELELQALPGIGPLTAERIVAYRNRHGPFEKEKDITEVEGIGPKTYANLFLLITVGGALRWNDD